MRGCLARAARMVTAALSLVIAIPVPAQAAGNPTDKLLDVDCGRACLQDALEAVLDAIARKEISNLPLGDRVRSTQNGVEIRLDDGLWQTVDSIGKYRLFAIDPVSGQAGVYATMQQGARQLLVAVRIGTRDQKINEIEFVIATGNSGPGRDAAGPGAKMERMGQPRPQLLRRLPPRDRSSRAELVGIAESYFSTLAGSTGQFIAPFASTCHRLENGFATTNNKTGSMASNMGPDIISMGCEKQWRSGFFRFVTGIRDRRFPIVDEERGIVMAFAFFDHSATIREIRLSDGTTIPAPLRDPQTLLISEIFQIDKGRIDQVEAVLEAVPYKMRNELWKDGDQLP